MPLIPLARIASSTWNVATVFCCKSLPGCSRPKRTSALAAKWNTNSHPAIAAVSAGRSRLSPAHEPETGLLRARRREIASWPVEKSSQPTTSWPVAQEAVGEAAADEAGRAGEEIFHAIVAGGHAAAGRAC